jgi:Pyruvate/2-oxoacid:ferredoxin oxidoreductase delta subunit
MCEFCIKHGEGKKWYEVMEHYSRELFAQDNRRQFMKTLFPSLQKDVHRLGKLAAVKKKLPLAYRFIRHMATRKMKRIHFGQVVPVEDAEMIIDMVQSITRLPCVCRGVTKGNTNARYCFALGIDPDGILDDYSDLKKSMEVLTREEAKKLIRAYDDEGLVHSIWTFKTPYIGGLCNCDGDCVAYRTQVGSDLMQVMFKAEYVAEIDPSRCMGCRNCQKLCQFGAIEYSSLDKKSMVNVLKCYGCGVCRSACRKEAVILFGRGAVPEAAGLW